MIANILNTGDLTVITDTGQIFPVNSSHINFDEIKKLASSRKDDERLLSLIKGETQARIENQTTWRDEVFAGRHLRWNNNAVQQMVSGDAYQNLGGLIGQDLHYFLNNYEGEFLSIVLPQINLLCNLLDQRNLLIRQSLYVALMCKQLAYSKEGNIYTAPRNEHRLLRKLSSVPTSIVISPGDISELHIKEGEIYAV